MSKITWVAKAPDEVLDYVHDWTDRLAGDTISGTPTAVVDDNSGVVIDDTSTAGANQTVWVSGGTDGQSARILLTVQTVQGRTYVDEITLPVVDGGA